MNHVYEKRLRHLLALLAREPLRWKPWGSHTGEACADREFNLQGLTTISTNNYYSRPLYVDYDGKDATGQFAAYVGNIALMRFFNLTEKEFDYLFLEESYTTPSRKALVRRLDKHIKGMGV